MTDDATIRHILATCKTIAVVGLSPKPHRASFDVSRYMQAHGWRIIPINPAAVASGATILGEKVYATLLEAAQHETIDLVNVFRNAEDVPPVVDEAIAIGAQAVWLQLGIAHDAALEKARAAGLQVIQDKCLKVEHAIRA
jgi:predicted CoA-binding protein